MRSRLLAPLLSLGLLIYSQAGSAAELGVDQMLQGLQDELQLSRDRLEKTRSEIRSALNRYLDQGQDRFEQFRTEFEAESRSAIEQIETMIDHDQLESIENAIRQEVFEV